MRPHALIITIVGRLNNPHNWEKLNADLLAAIQPVLQAHPEFVPAYPPVTITNAELQDERPIGWEKQETRAE